MAKRDPEKTARNKVIANLTNQLKVLEPSMLKESGIESIASFNGLYGGKHADYIDIKNEIIHSPDHFVALYLQGFKDMASNSYGAHNRNFKILQNSPKLKEYLYIFLKRTYLNNFEALSKKRPTVEESAIWIGQNNAAYGLLVTPRFNKKTNQWENDKSEIRHFSESYWTIGHVLETGLVIPGDTEVMSFDSEKSYLDFFVNVLVRNSGSKYEYMLAKMYRDYVLSAPDPRKIPLLIPEYRYKGADRAHKYRLDFTIIDPHELTKIGFELSPWSSHGYLSKTKELSQGEINEMAKDNFEKEMKKHKSFFRKHGIFVLIYTDNDLKEPLNIFSDMEKYLEAKTRPLQLRFQLIHELLN